jgi:hypothetical protein
MSERLRGRRYLVAVLCVGCALFAACSSSSKAATATTTTLPSTVTRPAGVTTTLVPIEAHKGQESVYIRSVDLTAHTITVDPIAFLTGAAAIEEYHKLNPKAGNSAPPNDYAIVNSVLQNEVFKFPATALVRLAHVGGKDYTQPKKATQKNLASEPASNIRVFWITVKAGTVTEVDEQFVP